ncbi:hypothetical protein KR222_003555 [Zaprionus bogoriensis]|nr:hypothetical protein KR222_003555 [Zaprionus bogoriensis]
MSCRAIEVPMQPYAGKLLIIDQLVLPLNLDELKVKPPTGKKTSSVSRLSDMSRLSYFDPEVIEKSLISFCTQEGIPKQFKNELVEGMLAAIETYMKHLVKSVIELCEHRAGSNLVNDPRCVVQHNMRTTMMFLNDREVADYGCSDDDSAHGHRRRWMKLQRNRSTNSMESEMRLESTNSTALMALGARKPALGASANLFSAPGLDRTISSASDAATLGKSERTQPPRTFVVRVKHVNIKDIIQFMEGEKRYAKSKLLFDAYLNYKW